MESGVKAAAWTSLGPQDSRSNTVVSFLGFLFGSYTPEANTLPSKTYFLWLKGLIPVRETITLQPNTTEKGEVPPLPIPAWVLEPQPFPLLPPAVSEPRGEPEMRTSTCTMSLRITWEPRLSSSTTQNYRAILVLPAGVTSEEAKGIVGISTLPGSTEVTSLRGSEEAGWAQGGGTAAPQVGQGRWRHKVTGAREGLKVTQSPGMHEGPAFNRKSLITPKT